MAQGTGGEAKATATPRQAMLLAAGQGSRLRPLTASVPKSMVPVGGRPLLEHTIAWLHSFGVDDIVVNLHHLPEVVLDHFGDGSPWGVRLTYSLEKVALGTAGGVRRMAEHFVGPFFVWYGDNLSTCDLRRLYRHHRSRDAVATIALLHRDDVTASGIVGLDAEDRITRFQEKPRAEEVFSHWVNAGIYVLEPAALAAIPAAGAPDFGRDVFPALLAHGARLSGYRLSADEGLWWIDTLADLHRVRSDGCTHLGALGWPGRRPG